MDTYLLERYEAAIKDGNMSMLDVAKELGCCTQSLRKKFVEASSSRYCKLILKALKKKGTGLIRLDPKFIIKHRAEIVCLSIDRLIELKINDTDMGIEYFVRVKSENENFLN